MISERTALQGFSQFILEKIRIISESPSESFLGSRSEYSQTIALATQKENTRKYTLKLSDLLLGSRVINKVLEVTNRFVQLSGDKHKRFAVLFHCKRSGQCNWEVRRPVPFPSLSIHCGSLLRFILSINLHAIILCQPTVYV